MAGELRITGGALVRRRIKVPAAADRGLLRPTADKVRAALFSSLGDVDDADVVDVFAGSGALGFEALSRGARHVTFVERDARSARVIEDNARALGVGAAVRVVVDDAARFLARCSQRFGLVLCDPPYALELDAALRDAIVRVLAPAGVLVVERSTRSDEGAWSGLSMRREREYGDTRVTIYDASSTTKDADDARASRGMEGTMSSTAAIYPGSFDPLTNGHIDIIKRGLKMFDRLIIAVANNPQKAPVFSVPERIALARQSLGDLPGLEIDTFDGLVVDFARKRNVKVLLRGLRAVSDFEYEFQLAGMNRRLAPEIETAFIVTSEDSFYVASRLVREVASFGGDVSSMVPAPVLAALHHKLGRKPGDNKGV